MLFILSATRWHWSKSRIKEKAAVEHFSCCHWNVNSIAAHDYKKFHYLKHIMLFTITIWYVFQKHILTLQYHLTKKIFQLKDTEGINLESVSLSHGLLQLIIDPAHILPQSSSCIYFIYRVHPFSTYANDPLFTSLIWKLKVVFIPPCIPITTMK